MKNYDVHMYVNRHGRWQATVTWSVDLQSCVLPKQRTYKTDDYRYRSYAIYEVDAVIEKIEAREKKNVKKSGQEVDQ